MNLRHICIYCGSSSGAHPAYTEAARQLATALVQRGLGLIYGGGRVGLMGTLADAVLAAGGTVTGVIPQALVKMEVAHHGLTDLRIVATMHERKALMADLADAFIALPGGFGTLEEICEVLTWAQLGLHQKPHGLLNTHDYYDSFLTFLDHAVAQKFIRPAHRQLLHTAADPDQLLHLLTQPQPPPVPKLLHRTQT